LAKPTAVSYHPAAIKKIRFKLGRLPNLCAGFSFIFEVEFLPSIFHFPGFQSTQKTLDMKSVMKNARWCFLCIGLLVAFSTTVLAQGTLTKRANVAINSNVNGFLEYLPQGYDPGGATRYPLLLFINGLNTQGNGSDAALELHFAGTNAPHEQQRATPTSTWVDEYTVNGVSSRFVIITPQFVTNFNDRMATPQEMNEVLNYAIQNYRIDTTRMYIMGHSSGGGPIWDYVGSSSAYAKRIAAILPFSAVAFPDETEANRIKNGGVAVWAFHNLLDNQVPVWFTQDYVNMINMGHPPLVPAKATYQVVNDHGSWFQAYGRGYTENGLNIYEWMLQYSKAPTRAFAGEDVEITPPANSAQVTGSGTGPNGTAASYTWTQVSGPNTATIVSPTNATTQFTGLTTGRYFFRLTITDNAGGQAFDDVAVTVHPTTVRIEAENFSASSGIMVENHGSPTDGTGQNVGSIDNNDWVEYQVTVPTSGNYKVRFRVATFMAGAQFQVTNAGGTVLASENPIATNWQDYLTYVDTIQLAAGTQTIRIQSTGSSFNLNWIEVVTGQNTVLPVNFSLFNAQCNNGAVVLNWKTASEVNTRNFTVEKSSNGRDWEILSTVAAAGRPGAETAYSHRDGASNPGTQYRIVGHDIDGRKTYTTILRSNCSGKAQLSVFPNPVTDVATLRIGAEGATRLKLYIADSKGSVVHRMERALPEGTTQLSIPMSHLSKGTYTLYAEWGGETKTVQVVKN
jgi:hypothetical protein